MSFLISRRPAVRVAGGKSMADMFGGSAAPVRPGTFHTTTLSARDRDYAAALWRNASPARSRATARV